LVKEE